MGLGPAGVEWRIGGQAGVAELVELGLLLCREAITYPCLGDARRA